MTKGVKFMLDEEDRVFFVHLDCFNEFECHDGFYTTDCIVTDIENANNHKKRKRIRGRAYAEYTYSVGQRITGEKIYYCHSVEELEKRHIKKVNGKYEKLSTTEYIQAAREQHGGKIGLVGVFGIISGILKAMGDELGKDART